MNRRSFLQKLSVIPVIGWLLPKATGSPVNFNKEDHPSYPVPRTNKKHVVVRHTVEVVHEVPDDWAAGDVNFFYNESLHCASNLVNDLSKVKKEYCLCGVHNAEYLREATREDKKIWKDF